MRTLAVAVLFASIASVAYAQTPQATTPEALTAVYRCADLTDGQQRLACYDAAVGRLEQAQTQGQIVAVDRAEVAAIERESFGFAMPSLSSIIPSFGGDRDDDADRRVANVDVTISRIVDRAHGRHAFVTSDGQTWTQVEAQRTSNVRVGDTVTIRRGAIGNYMLSPSRGGAAHRVRREE